MKKILLLIVPLLASCGDPEKAEFMNACTGGNSNEYHHELCSCAYSKIRSQYGGTKKMEQMLFNDSSTTFFNKMRSIVESCQSEVQ